MRQLFDVITSNLMFQGRKIGKNKLKNVSYTFKYKCVRMCACVCSLDKAIPVKLKH